MSIRYESVLRADGFDYGVVCGADPGSYGGLVATRFLLGLFESGCLPLFVRPENSTSIGRSKHR